MVCKRGRVHLHHLTYARFGHEELTDVMPLCPVHHEDVHKGRIPQPKPKIPPSPDAVEVVDGQEFNVITLPPLERGWVPWKTRPKSHAQKCRERDRARNKLK